MQESEQRGQENVDPVKHRKIMRRPALLVLDRLIPIFPTLTGLAKHLHAALVYVTEYDTDEGMKTSAQAALARLTLEMESQRPGRWLELDAYNINTSNPETTVPTSSAPSMEIDPVKPEEIKMTEAVSEIKSPPPIVAAQDGDDMEEGLIPSSHKEEGELGKSGGGRRLRGRKVNVDEVEHRSSGRKRTAAKLDGASPPVPDPPPPSRKGGNVRDDPKRKREAPNRPETNIEQRRLRGPRRDDARRKS